MTGITVKDTSTLVLVWFTIGAELQRHRGAGRNPHSRVGPKFHRSTEAAEYALADDLRASN